MPEACPYGCSGLNGRDRSAPLQVLWSSVLHAEGMSLQVIWSECRGGRKVLRPYGCSGPDAGGSAVADGAEGEDLAGLGGEEGAERRHGAVARGADEGTEEDVGEWVVPAVHGDHA